MSWFPSWEETLIVWTSLAALWWIMAYVLVRTSGGATAPSPPDGSVEVPLDRRTLSVFKPLASPLDDRELHRLLPCLESFIADLDEHSELLIGCHEPERAALTRFVDDMRRAYPRARVRLVVAAGTVDWPNPKVGMLRTLARSAEGELWFWSDADVLAPPGTLRRLRADFAAGDAPLLTCPYVIADGGSGAGMLDKLYVNLEIHPGVLLLGRLGPVGFGLGAGMLFEAQRFRRRVDWEELGRSLADDYRLGGLLAPAELASVRLTTIPAARGLRAALRHYLRWHKTVRWCQPWGYAAQLLVLPVLGWLAAAVSAPGEPAAWLGLAAVLALDSVAAWTVCRALDCPIPPRRLPVLPLWSLARGIAWGLSWLPGPVFWRGRAWWRPVARRRVPVPVLVEGREETRRAGSDGTVR